MAFRILKAITLAMLMYFSLRFLGISKGTAFAICLIPSVLGSLNIMSGPVYALTGLVFILACGSTLVPELKIDTDSVVKLVSPFLKKSVM